MYFGIKKAIESYKNISMTFFYSVHVYFPTNYEKDVIAVHAIRKTGPGVKYKS